LRHGGAFNVRDMAVIVGYILEVTHSNYEFLFSLRARLT